MYTALKHVNTIIVKRHPLSKMHFKNKNIKLTIKV